MRKLGSQIWKFNSPIKVCQQGNQWLETFNKRSVPSAAVVEHLGIGIFIIHNELRTLGLYLQIVYLSSWHELLYRKTKVFEDISFDNTLIAAKTRVYNICRYIEVLVA